jgi:hypothetical protein
VDIQESGYMALIEEADVTKIDRLLEEHGRRDKSSVDKIPGCPHVMPFVDGRQAKRRALLGLLNQRRERELRAFQQPQGVLRSFVGPPVDGTEASFSEQ